MDSNLDDLISVCKHLVSHGTNVTFRKKNSVTVCVSQEQNVFEIEYRVIEYYKICEYILNVNSTNTSFTIKAGDKYFFNMQDLFALCMDRIKLPELIQNLTNNVKERNDIVINLKDNTIEVCEQIKSKETTMFKIKKYSDSYHIYIYCEFDRTSPYEIGINQKEFDSIKKLFELCVYRIKEIPIQKAAKTNQLQLSLNRTVNQLRKLCK